MSLKEAYRDYFKIGAAISGYNLKTDSHVRLLDEQFNSFTAENDMKPMYFLDEAECKSNPEKYNTEPAVHFDRARKYLDFAKAHHLTMRGHVLVWHNQTPRSFFHVNYQEDAPFADRQTMLARLESYIKSVLTFTQTEYPGIIYAWDVVNEAVDDGGYRSWSPWFQYVGPDFIEKAFEFARKYAAKDVLLFYNDYNTFEPWKRDFICKNILIPLKEKGLIDGMGMQSHLLMDTSLEDYRIALDTFGALGLVVHMTELDIHNNDPSEESMQALADKYAKLFGIILDAKKSRRANVECVTFWNLIDETSWLSGFRKETSYPLLFHKEGEPKKAYYAVMELVK